jgi:hypothetical protein
VSVDASPRAPLRTHARWTAVLTLDALRAPGVAVTPLAAADLPPGVQEGLLVTYPDGASYRLGFDGQTRLVWMQGPLDLSPFAAGDVTARLADHRRTGGVLLPFAVSYALGTTPLADEKVLTACVDPADLSSASFTAPTRLPDCR